jgi:8-oxo-dGTP diphosphatase
LLHAKGVFLFITLDIYMTGVSVAIIVNHDKVLLSQRVKSARYGLKWEFPGGKIEEGETPEAALLRECKEELSINVESYTLLEKQRIIFPDKGDFYVHFFLVTRFSGMIVNHVFEQIRWIDIEDCLQYDLLDGNIDICTRLPDLLEENGVFRRGNH